MRQFFISFMAAIAGFWISLALLFVAVVMFMGVAAAGMFTGKGNPAPAKLQKHSVLTIDLGCVVEEQTDDAPDFSALFNGKESSKIALPQFVAALQEAAGDEAIEGIALECNGISAGMAQLETMRSALAAFRSSDKWIYAYSGNYTQADYYLASVADSVFVNPVGMVDIHGLSSTTLYFKNLLDKLGIDIQVVKVGTFKSAVEPYMLTGMSEANRLQQEVYLGNIWDEFSGAIAESRGITAEKLNEVASASCYSQPLEWYVGNRIVDRGIYEREFDDLLAKVTSQDEARTVSLGDYCKIRAVDPYSNKGKATVALLYAVGSITEDGDDGIASSRLVPQILEIAEDDDIDALVMRVNSGGGSAYASEQIWEALQHFKAKTSKPFYVSMGDYAASGGYYISCGADKIFAQPLTLTGSIGIFGMIPSAQKLLNDKLGVNTATVATNPGGEFPGVFKDMSPAQREAMQRYVDRGYELFTSRCAMGRHLSVDSIKAIAEGRVWDGKSALNIGLVDALGGLDDTFAAMKEALDGRSLKIKLYSDNEFDIMRELKKSLSGMRTSIVRSELGSLYEVVEPALKLRDAAPLQCRMEPVVIN